MAHHAQDLFIRGVKYSLPHFFKRESEQEPLRVLDCGSLDINGSNRGYFSGAAGAIEYTGIDVGAGPGVDLVCPAWAYGAASLPADTPPAILANDLGDLAGTFDVVISTEMLEHSRTWAQDLENMVRLLRPGGLLVVTAAGDGRPEHGTTRSLPADAPFTNDYYCNVSNWMFAQAVKPGHFEIYSLRQLATDLQFFGVKDRASVAL